MTRSSILEPINTLRWRSTRRTSKRLTASSIEQLATKRRVQPYWLYLHSHCIPKILGLPLVTSSSPLWIRHPLPGCWKHFWNLLRKGWSGFKVPLPEPQERQETIVIRQPMRIRPFNLRGINKWRLTPMLLGILIVSRRPGSQEFFTSISGMIWLIHWVPV